MLRRAALAVTMALCAVVVTHVIRADEEETTDLTVYAISCDPSGGGYLYDLVGASITVTHKRGVNTLAVFNGTTDANGEFDFTVYLQENDEVEVDVTETYSSHHSYTCDYDPQGNPGEASWIPPDPGGAGPSCEDGGAGHTLRVAHHDVGFGG